MLSALFLSPGYLLQIGAIGVGLWILSERESRHLYDGSRPPRRPLHRFLRWSSHWLFYPLHCCTYVGLLGLLEQPLALMMLPEFLSGWTLWNRAAFVLLNFGAHSVMGFGLVLADPHQSGPAAAVAVLLAAAAAAMAPILTQLLFSKSATKDCVVSTNALCVVTTLAGLMFGRANASD